MLEVDLVAQDLTGLLVGAQGVQRRGHHGARPLLVVEDGEARHGDQGEEDGEAARPLEALDAYKKGEGRSVMRNSNGRLYGGN